MLNPTTSATSQIRIEQLTIAEIMARLLPTMGAFTWPLFAAIVGGWIYLTILRFEYSTPFAVICGSSWVAIYLCLQANRGGAPLLAALMLQHGIAYGLPLLVENKSIEGYDAALALPCAIQFATFVGAAFLGWQALLHRSVSRPSKWQLFQKRNIKDSGTRLAVLGLTIFLYSILMEYSFFTGLFFSIGEGSALKIFSFVRVTVLVAALTGCFLCGYSLSVAPAFKLVFWLCFGFYLAIIISSVLLSSAVGVILATTVGLFLGSRRIPWVPLVVVLGAIAFLNQGKAEIRAMYWRDGAMQIRSVAELPKLYSEWSEASWSRLDPSVKRTQNDDAGQSLFDRIDNLQNLFFIERCLLIERYPTLNGSGYTYIPLLLIPRMMWKEKPRTHEGMILLNLHFKRQSSVEETQKTYIAWGLLPEAMGNFGLWYGPIVLGLVLGAALGFVEVWSRNKSLISIEGGMAIIGLLSTIASYEMVMSVLVTGLFQTLVVVIFGGLVVRQFLNQ